MATLDCRQCVDNCLEDQLKTHMECEKYCENNNCEHSYSPARKRNFGFPSKGFLIGISCIVLVFIIMGIIYFVSWYRDRYR